MENSVKFSGGAVAALVAIRCAGSLRSACVVGMLSGLFAHSLYADVLHKRRRRRRRGRQGGDKRQEERREMESGGEEVVEEEEEAADAET